MSESSRPGPAPQDTAGARWAAALAEHERLVHWVVRRQDLGPLPYRDAVHEGRIGLWRAVRGYDPTRGIRFSSYAVPAIRRAVWAAVARERAPLGDLVPPRCTGSSRICSPRCPRVSARWWSRTSGWMAARHRRLRASARVWG